MHVLYASLNLIRCSLIFGNFGGLDQTPNFYVTPKTYGCLTFVDAHPKFVDSAKHFKATKIVHHYSTLVITKNYAL